MELSELKARVENLRFERDMTMTKLRAAEDQYGIALAENIGVRIGSIVSLTDRRTKQRFCITKIELKEWRQGQVALWGKTIRKDGTLGMVKEIWQDWVLETEPAAQLEMK